MSLPASLDDRRRTNAPERRCQLLCASVLVWIHVWKPHVIEFFAIGTAVLPLAQEIAPEKIADPIMVLSVND